MASQDPELTLMLEQLFFGRTIEVSQPLQVTVLGTDFGATVVRTQGNGEQNLAASALDLARQTETRNMGVGSNPIDVNSRTSMETTMNIGSTNPRIMGGGY